MPPLLIALFSGMASGAGYMLAQAGGKLISYIPTKSQSNRDKIYAESHKLNEIAVATNFNPDEYAKHAGILRDTIRSAANSASN